MATSYPDKLEGTIRFGDTGNERDYHIVVRQETAYTMLVMVDEIGGEKVASVYSAGSRLNPGASLRDGYATGVGIAIGHWAASRGV